MHSKITVPIRIESEANRRDHWADKARRTQLNRSVVRLTLSAKLDKRQFDSDTITIVLTRHAPRKIKDLDNLVSAFKATRDGVADFLGIDDGSQRLVWLYEQRQSSQFGVTIEITDGLKRCQVCGGKGVIRD